MTAADAPAGAPVDTPAADGPPGWPALWREMLAVRAAAAEARRLANDGPLRLRHDEAAGWTLASGAAGDPLDEWFALHKPLLDARHAQRTRGVGPWVVAQLGQSLDGCVATASGHSDFVTGPQSLTHLHRLRALCDAVLVGAGTVAADDPQLTTRRVPGPHPVRVLLDPAARLDGRAQALHDGRAPTLWLCDARHAPAAAARLAALQADPSAVARDWAASGDGAPVSPPVPAETQPARAEVIAVPDLLDATGRGLRPQAAVAALAARGLRLLFVEGGGVTVSRFLDAGALDRLHLVIAPVLIGDGRRGLHGPARMTMDDCPRPPARVHSLGDDRLWDLDLRPR